MAKWDFLLYLGSQAVALQESHATAPGATREGVAPGGLARLAATSSSRRSWFFDNANVYISRAIACGATQVLVAPRNLARLKGLVFGILDRYGLFIKF
jgi:hypothetical protein